MLLKSTEKHGKHTGEVSRKVKFLCICNRAHFVPDCVCPYAEIKRATCFPYNEQPDLKEYRKVCMEFLKIAHPRVLADRAEHGDGEAYLELGLMLIGGTIECTYSIEGALHLFDPLTDRVVAGDRFVGDTVPNDLLAKAHSASAWAYWREWSIHDEEEFYRVFRHRAVLKREFNPKWRIEIQPLFFAAIHASVSAALGLVSEVVLEIGFAFKQYAEQAGIQDVRRMRQFSALWRVVKAREDEIIEMERRSRAKQGKTMSLSDCAAEGCLVKGVPPSTLRRCKGRCPPDLKPCYCSKACQKKDWPAHKAICKPGSIGKQALIEENKEDFATHFGSLILSIEGATEDGGVGNVQPPRPTIDLPGFHPGRAGPQARDTSLRAQLYKLTMYF
ncbi:hypothetical protein OH76DRAFT_1406312 [Lentinus brumalis]|uniref:MYND-type domain-containing protein n=1 Tax=Lentinus brumalis TaxID=2498619 RepID=A0A371D3T4_9APHY|nr:hypothetical protein OH76DRAFT_1406312 [Polyporus brumalis]